MIPRLADLPLNTCGITMIKWPSLLCNQRGTILIMIVSFRHKGLRKFFESGDRAGIQPHHATRLRYLLTVLDAAETIEGMNRPGFRLHPLRAVKTQRWSVHVDGNWRITFEFIDGNAHIIDYEDYH
ncbi:type II toxin-antitoxin system RelE/ParE family toxin [Duganella sp. PWIR1]